MSAINEQQLKNWWAEDYTPVHADSRVAYLVDAHSTFLTMCLCWLRGVSIRKVDGFAFDCFIFLKSWLSQMKEYTNISCICIKDADAIRYGIVSFVL